MKPSEKKPDPELIQALREFVGAFEVLFHYDWNYTIEMIGDEAQGRTFLDPGLEDETEDWGSRGNLLEKYRRIKKLMEENGIPPVFDPPLSQGGYWLPDN
jgi:hypothetical protein